MEKLAGWGKGEENTYIGSLRVVLSALGENISYDQLMGVSGAAFRLQINQPDWCPSAPDATVGFNCSEIAAKAVGYSSRSINHNSFWVFRAVKRIRAAIVESIDEGRPLVGIDLDGEMDWGVITGYEDEAKSLLCRIYDDDEDDYVKARDWHCAIEILTKNETAPDLRDSIMESLRIAVYLANTESFGNYASGFNAYKVWIRDLLDDARYEDIDQEKSSKLIHPNAWCYYSLYDARNAAARYLESVKYEFKPEIEVQLKSTGEIYKKIADILGEGQQQAPFPHQLKNKPWTEEMRHREADVLKEALSLEREAINVFKSIIAQA